MLDIEKLTNSIIKKTSELKKEIFPSHNNDYQEPIHPNDHKKSIDDYERDDGLSKVIANRLKSMTLNERIEKGLEERKESIQSKLQKEIQEIRDINDKSLKEMGKK